MGWVGVLAFHIRIQILIKRVMFHSRVMSNVVELRPIYAYRDNYINSCLRISYCLFSGTFPYTMFATMPIFSSCDWPKRIYQQLHKIFAKKSPKVQQSRRNTSCVYTRDNTVSKGKVRACYTLSSC